MEHHTAEEPDADDSSGARVSLESLLQIALKGQTLQEDLQLQTHVRTRLALSAVSPQRIEHDQNLVLQVQDFRAVLEKLLKKSDLQT